MLHFQFKMKKPSTVRGFIATIEMIYSSDLLMCDQKRN